MYLVNKDETEHTGQVRLHLHLVFIYTQALFICSFKHFPFFQVCWKSVSVFFSSTGIICVEDVSGAMLGFLSGWRLFQETVWGPAGLKQVRVQPTILSSELWAVYQLLISVNVWNVDVFHPNNPSFSFILFRRRLPVPCFFSTKDDATWCI